MPSDSPFDEVRLVCPRCRQLEDNTLSPCRLVRCDGTRVVLGDLEGVSHLICPRCDATYPVVDGIPIIFAAAGAVDDAHNPPHCPLSTPIETLHAILQRSDPRAPLSTLVTRLGKYLWTGYHDWLLPALPPLVPVPVHAVDVVAWLRQLADAPEGVTAILGAACGREAWETHSPTVLVDAHFSSLHAAMRLVREGALDFLLPDEPGLWRKARIEIPPSASIPTVCSVCCDVLDPPFEAECFSEVIATNLLDSVRDPYFALGQACALLGGKQLAITSPFCWHPDVTPREKWWSNRQGVVNSEEALFSDLASLAPHLSVRAARDFPWGHWGNSREMTLFQSRGYCFRTP